MRLFRNCITIFIFFFHTSSISAQTTKDLFTQPGLSLNSYFVFDQFSGYSASFSYHEEVSVCDKTASVFYHNQSSFRYHFYFEGKKMYFLNPDNCKTTLYMDFGLEVNNIVPAGKYQGCKVDAKYPITLLNGEERTRIDLSCPYPYSTSLIEGIGDIIYGFPDEFFTLEGGASFVCAKLGDELLWQKEGEEELCDSLSCLFPKVEFTVETNDFSVEFTNNTLFGEFYEWDFGDGTTSTDENPSHTYEQPGCYQVTLKAGKSCRSNSSSFSKKVAICEGLAWEEDYFIDTIFKYKVFMVDQTIEYLYNTRGLYKTIDGGQTLEKLALPSLPAGVGQYIYEVYFFDEHNGILNAGHNDSNNEHPHIYVTHDGGQTWEPKVEGIGFGYQLFLGENGLAWITPYFSGNHLYRTLDYGKNWERIEYEENVHIKSFEQIDEQTVYAIAFIGDDTFGAYRKGISTDQGENWVFEEFSHGIYQATYFDKDQGYAVQEGKFYKTQNSGIDWELIDLGIEIETIHFNSSTHGWIKASDHTVYYTSDRLATLQSTNCSLNNFGFFKVLNDTMAYGMVHETSSIYSNWPQKFLFSKNKLGGCESFVDLDNDGYNSNVDCDDSNPDVNPGAEEIVGNMIDDDCDGEVDELDTSVEEELAGIRIYPNPASSLLFVETEGNPMINIEMVDVRGRVILREKGKDQLDVNGLDRGLYFIRVLDMESRVIGVRKVVLE